ncbi:MAG TPA: metal-dependent hydrolase [Thermoplasmata archaeon]|nr:metal-dependent hydrolase [Thermoplasmata archaeon]
MDLFTHVLVAYLVTFGIVGFQPSYLAAGALAGGLPDADALFWPLARRFPLLQHHGITHSFFGVTVVAIVGAVLGPLIAPGSALIYFVVMEVGGTCHILQDGFTHFSVPPLAPFSDRRLEIDADRAINFVTMAVSIASFYLLLVVERNHVPFGTYLATVYALMAFFAAYFAIRLWGRFRIGRYRRAVGPNAVPVPTTNPFHWVILSEEQGDGRVRTTWARYTLGRGLVDGPYSVEAPLAVPPHTGAPANAREALEWSYAPARAQSRVLAMTYHFGEAFQSAAGAWVAVWYSLEFTAFGRASAVRVSFPADGGAPQVRSTFYKPTHRAV